MKTPPSLPAGMGIAGALKRLALQKEGVEETIACKGTALESASFKVSGKAFLFVSAKEARFKLEASLTQAEAMAQAHPGGIKVGTRGWVTLDFGAAVPSSVWEAWVEESYQLMAGKKAKPAAKRPKTSS